MEKKENGYVTVPELEGQEQLLVKILKKLEIKLKITPNKQISLLVKSWIQKYPTELILQSIDIAEIKKADNTKYVREVLMNLYNQKN